MEDYLKSQEARKARLAERIQRQSISVTSLHRVRITSEDIANNLRVDPHWTSLSLGYLLDITESLYLIDVATDDLGVVDVQLSDVTQDNPYGQAPFAERYFDSSGTKLLEMDTSYSGCPPDEFIGAGHVRFYMHYFDPTLELEFGDFQLKLPEPTPLPEWLAQVMAYSPPN